MVATSGSTTTIISVTAIPQNPTNMQDLEILKDIKHMLAKLKGYGQIKDTDELIRYQKVMDRAIRAVENQEEQKGTQLELL